MRMGYAIVQVMNLEQPTEGSLSAVPAIGTQSTGPYEGADWEEDDVVATNRQS